MTIFDLKRKTALVTGASESMGLAIATALADHSATVVISSRKQDDLDAAAEGINAHGTGKAVPITCNIRYKNQL